MNAYLSLAEKVFEIWKVPMSGREILARAYINDLVPAHLHGQTQHKTLQARLSENIRKARDKSIFCRTEPGVFFLRKFLCHTSKSEFRARPRVRELRRQRVLTVHSSCVKRNRQALNNEAGISIIQSCFAPSFAEYLDYKTALQSDNLTVWSFVIIYRDDFILSFRQGRYRENRDGFVNRRTIGFTSMPTDSDRNLFTSDDAGVLTSGAYAAAIDIDIPLTVLAESELRTNAKIEFYSVIEKCLVGVISLQCPDWFEPLKRRLAINDLQWLSIYDHPNNIDDFDPWSREILDPARSLIKEKLSLRAQQCLSSPKTRQSI